MTSMDDRTFVVTGGASGIGAATVAALSAAGARVIAADVAWDEAEAAPHRVERVAIDVSDARRWTELAEQLAASASLVAAALDRWGRLDTVVAYAGVALDEPG